jgi:predicted alpha/beta-fold hydrolase
VFRIDPPGEPRGAIAVFHGLGGTADGPNVRRFAAAAVARGFRVWAPEQLGAGGVERSPRLYTAADVEVFDRVARDPEFAVPGRPTLFAAFSLGAGMMLRWLGLRGADAPVDGALALSPIGHLPESARALRKTGNRLYDFRFAALYARRLAFATTAGRAPYDPRRHRTMRALDEDFASYWAGYPDAATYYEASSAHRTAERIARPLLIVSAEDDPFAPPESLRRYYGTSPFVSLRLSRHGSHVAFLGRRDGRLEPLFPELLLDPLDVP